MCRSIDNALDGMTEDYCWSWMKVMSKNSHCGERSLIFSLITLQVRQCNFTSCISVNAMKPFHIAKNCVNRVAARSFLFTATLL